MTGEFGDVGSGADLEHPQLDALRNPVLSGSVDAVIVRDLARLSRNSAHLQELQQELSQRGVKLYCITG